ncbi:MAG: phosphoglucomutase/phosphomannomutase family protein [Actinobacteria bacterium]|nr:phosphoglucomutase/phosphomannomutase family protein [Actinomycetota bacterium]
MPEEKKVKFGTDGWRAVIAEEFTFDNVGLVVMAIAQYLKNNNLNKKGIFIGFDNRFLSENFADHSARILAAMGFKVLLSDISIPTPLTAFMTAHYNLDGAIMITASHNPYKYNGIKFIPYYAGPAEDKVTKEIENNLIQLTNDEKRRQKIDFSCNNIEIISDFSSYKKKLIQIADADLIMAVKPKIALDTMFGAGSKIMPEILNENLNLNVKLFNNYRDPLFGGKLPDPSIDNLTALKDFVINNNFDIGIALDGDADRFGVIDGKGIFISPNNIIALILYHLIKTQRFSKEDIVVRTVATTHLIDEICKKYDLRVLETPVGFKYICKAMLEGNVLIGGEESGGLSVKGHIPEKDGLVACLLLIEIQSYLIKNFGRMYLSEYMNKIYKEFGFYQNVRLDLKISLEKKNKILAYFLNFKSKKISGAKVLEIIGKDGVKIILDNGSWFLIRPSGTEPLIRCYIESKDKIYFEFLKDFIKTNINKFTNQVVNNNL